MRANQYLAGLAAAALLLTACGKMDSSSSGSSSSDTSGSGSGQKQDAWKTGLAIQTETKAGDKSGEMNSIAAAVLLDEDGRIVQVVVDELEGVIRKGTLSALCESSSSISCMAMPRRQEIFACFNRYRGLKV